MKNEVNRAQGAKKSVMIVFNQANTGRVEYMLDVLGIKGFTFFEQVQGRGTNGGEPRRGTHAWPEMNSCVITVVEDEQLPALLESIKKLDMRSRVRLGYCSYGMIQIEKVNKSFGAQQVLKDVSLTIPEGQVLGLLGPNGAGKSTLMKILIGLWKADSGMVSTPPRIGYLPENNPLYEEMYVIEYLRFMAEITGVESRKSKVERLIDMVGLTPECHKHIRELSKGYRQRVGLAQALLGDPQLLILDEPTTGLDPNQLVEIRSLIRSLGKDRTVILSTHIMQEVREMCDRVVILDHGEIKADKPINEIIDLEQLFIDSTHGRI